MASLKKLALAATGTMIVKDAKGEEVSDENGKWSITFTSPGTEKYEVALAKHKKRTAGNLKSLMGGKDDAQDPAQERLDRADFLAAVTDSFNGFDYEGKKGHAAFRAAYADLELIHVAQQADQYLGNLGNFSKPPATEPVKQSDTSHG